MQAAATLHTAPLARPRPGLPLRRAQGRDLVVMRADGPLREFREDTGEVTTSGSGGEGGKEEKQQGQPKYLYADENPPPPRDTMSPEMKARLRQEYYGLGGAPNQKMGSNYFLWIILGISLLAVLSKLTGAI